MCLSIVMLAYFVFCIKQIKHTFYENIGLGLFLLEGDGIFGLVLEVSISDVQCVNSAFNPNLISIWEKIY